VLLRLSIFVELVQAFLVDLPLDGGCHRSKNGPSYFYSFRGGRSGASVYCVPISLVQEVAFPFFWYVFSTRVDRGVSFFVDHSGAESLSRPRSEYSRLRL